MNILVIGNENYENLAVAQMIKKCDSKAVVHCMTEYREILAYLDRYSVDAVFAHTDSKGHPGMKLLNDLYQKNKKINVVIIADTKAFCIKALDKRVSGYILAPVTEGGISVEMEHLRYGKCGLKKRVYINTFGNFEVYVDGRPIHFPKQAAKQALAYLVDRNGGVVERKELTEALFSEREYTRGLQAYMSQILICMRKVLEQNGIEDILISGSNNYAIAKDKVTCDLFGFYDGNPKYVKLFKGAYMSQYDWGNTYSAGILEYRSQS